MRPEITPPKGHQRLFRWFCDPALHEELAGDIEEQFRLDASQQGLKKARANYRKEVLLLIRPSVIKRIQLPTFLPDTVMFKNYLKIQIKFG